MICLWIAEFQEKYENKELQQWEKNVNEQMKWNKASVEI